MSKFVDRTNNICYVECNYCGKEDIVHEINYEDINTELRSEGWMFKKVDSEWCDFCCKECLLKYNRKKTYNVREDFK